MQAEASASQRKHGWHGKQSVLCGRGLAIEPQARSGYLVTCTNTPLGLFVAPSADTRMSPEEVPTGKAVPSTHTVMVDGAVPEVGDILSQGALVVAVHLSVPPPALVMVTDPPEGHPRVL